LPPLIRDFGSEFFPLGGPLLNDTNRPSLIRWLETVVGLGPNTPLVCGWLYIFLILLTRSLFFVHFLDNLFFALYRPPFFFPLASPFFVGGVALTTGNHRVSICSPPSPFLAVLYMVFYLLESCLSFHFLMVVFAGHWGHFGSIFSPIPSLIAYRSFLFSQSFPPQPNLIGDYPDSLSPQNRPYSSPRVFEGSYRNFFLVFLWCFILLLCSLFHVCLFLLCLVGVSLLLLLKVDGAVIPLNWRSFCFFFFC